MVWDILFLYNNFLQKMMFVYLQENIILLFLLSILIILLCIIDYLRITNIVA
jgi:hypothetical protein